MGENPLLEYSPMDTWRVSNSVSFINRSRKRRKASKFCLPTLGTSALLIRGWEGGRGGCAPSTIQRATSIVVSSRNFTKFLSYVPRCNVTCPTRFLEDGGEPSAKVSRKGSCPRQRWMLAWKGKWKEEGIPSGSQAKVLALSRHRVLRGDGTWREREREKESGKGLGRGKALFPGRRKFTPSC